MEDFARIVNTLKSLTIISKLSILDVYGGPGWSSDWRECFLISLKGWSDFCQFNRDSNHEREKFPGEFRIFAEVYSDAVINNTVNLYSDDEVGAHRDSVSGEIMLLIYKVNSQNHLFK